MIDLFFFFKSFYSLTIGLLKHPITQILVYNFFAAVALFGCYIAVMALRDLRDTKGLSATQKVLGYPLLIIGMPLDVLINDITATIAFVQWPKGLNDTLSARAKRCNRSSPTTALGRYQKMLGTWVLVNVAPFDRTGWHNPV